MPALALLVGVGLLGFSGQSSPGRGLNDPARDQIAEKAILQVDAESTDCWGQILESDLPTILYCGRRDTSNLRATRKAMDQALLSHSEVSGPEGRWTWRNHREYYARDFATASGPLEARIYYSKNLVGVGYVVTLTAHRVEAIWCDDPEMEELYKDLPSYEHDEGGFTTAVQTVKVPAIYPERAFAARLKGSVQVRARILADGNVVDACIIGSKRPKVGFEEAAVAAVMTWRFRPAAYQGNPVDSKLETFVEFAP